MIDEAESTLSNADNASDRLVQNVLKQAHQSGSYSPGAHLFHFVGHKECIPQVSCSKCFCHICIAAMFSRWVHDSTSAGHNNWQHSERSKQSDIWDLGCSSAGIESHASLASPTPLNHTSMPTGCQILYMCVSKVHVSEVAYHAEASSSASLRQAL